MLDRDFLLSVVLSLAAGAVGLVLAERVHAQTTEITNAPGIPMANEPDMQVLFDSGASLPLAPYISYLLAGVSQEGVLDGLRFPWSTRLESTVLRTDAVQVFKNQWMTQPLFIVGTDTTSAKWLEHNLEVLHRMGAWGMVVQADSPENFKALQTIADGLPLAPVQSPWLEQLLLDKGVGVYPLLVQANGQALQILASPTSQSKARPALHSRSFRMPRTLRQGIHP